MWKEVLEQMENVSKINTNFVLLGVVEMENFWYLYATLAIMIYAISMILSSLIVYVVWLEVSLHEPMYIFISNLVANVMFGSSSVLPKLAIDLFYGLNIIPLPGCLIQAFCYQSFGTIELMTFTAMSYDRYLAVGHPLRYPTLMANDRAFKVLLVISIFAYASIGINVILAARLTMCGVYINGVYCETMSLLRLACGDTTVNNVFGTTWTVTVVGSCILLSFYCYIRTFIVCLQISAQAHQKAIHTLVTHIVTFSTFMATSLFVIFRYRLGNGSLSIVAHVVIAIAGLIISVTLNPLVYGIRTEALRIKISVDFRTTLYVMDSVDFRTPTYVMDSVDFRTPPYVMDSVDFRTPTYVMDSVDFRTPPYVMDSVDFRTPPYVMDSVNFITPVICTYLKEGSSMKT
ncbi:PREDICTED: olfactory receptor 1020-like [Nanorana parkeri]|uniref:olfactory receptor 1020-like n=1 Tax=Nanorana parkeri TaxID=125878 RepID=UPI00085465EE|nr:PREDICTED: olfactory receptor 1020-like [Nanorana parkeri]